MSDERVVLADGLFNTKILGTVVKGEIRPYEAPVNLRCSDCGNKIQMGEEMWTSDPNIWMGDLNHSSLYEYERDVFCLSCAVERSKILRKFPRLVVKIQEDVE